MSKLIATTGMFVISILVFVMSVHTSNAQWVQMSNGMGNFLFVLGFAANGNTIFAGTAADGAYISTDNGANWTHASLPNQAVYTFAVNGSNIFAGTNGNGVYVSTNNGTSWTQTSLNNRFVAALEVIGTNVFAGTNTFGAYISANNGASWTQTSLNNRSVYAFAVNGSNIFAGTGLNNGVYVSADNGTSWTQTSLNNRDVRSLAVIGNNIFAGTIGQGIYLSTNNGTSWSQTSFNNTNALSLATSGNNIFVGTPITGFYVSTNNGTNWTQRVEGLTNQQVFTIRVMNSYIFAGTNGSSVYRGPLGELTDVQATSNEVPQHFSLSQNYPNPFNPSTSINYQLPFQSHVTLKMYDVLSREVAILVDGAEEAGYKTATFDATNVASGVYFYRIEAGDFVQTRKLLLLR